MITSYLRTETNQAMVFGNFITFPNPVRTPLPVNQTQTLTYGIFVLGISTTEVPVILFIMSWHLNRTLPQPASHALWENRHERVTQGLYLALILLFVGFIVISLDLFQSALVEVISIEW